MAKIDDLTRLKHIEQAAREAISFSESRSREDLESNRMLSLALVRLIEIIGEAANGISMDRQDKYSEIPWRRIVGMRNRLIHAYFEIDLDIVWQVVTNDLPLILTQVNHAISELENPN